MQRRLLGAIAAAMVLAASLDTLVLLSGTEGSAPSFQTAPFGLGVRQQIDAQYEKLQAAGVLPGAGKPAGRPGQRGEFCLIWLWKLFQTYGLADMLRPGRPRKVTDQLAREAAAAIIKASKAKDFISSRTVTAACERIPGVVKILTKSPWAAGSGGGGGCQGAKVVERGKVHPRPLPLPRRP